MKVVLRKLGRNGKLRQKKKKRAGCVRINLKRIARQGGNLRIKGICYKDKNKSINRNFVAEVKEYLKRQELPFTIQTETPTDGDCFYHGVLDFLMDNPSLIENAKHKFSKNTDLKVSHLKTALIQHRRSLGTDSIVCERCSNNCKNGSQHLDYLSRKNKWADEFVIQGLTSLFNISLCLISPDSKPVFYSWGDENPDSNVIYMFYFPGLHFQLIKSVLSDRTLKLILDTLPTEQIETRRNCCLLCKTALSEIKLVICPNCNYLYHHNSCFDKHGCINDTSPQRVQQRSLESIRMTRKYRSIISSSETKDSLDQAADCTGEEASFANRAFQLWTTTKSYV